MTGISGVALWIVLAVAVVAIAAAIIAGMAAVRSRAAIRQRAEHIGALEHELRMRDEETVHLVEHRLPALAAGAWQASRGDVPGPAHQGLAGSRFAYAQESAVELFRGVSKDAEQTAQELLLAVARKLQGLANNQQMKITEMTEGHDDPAFLADLMHIDHTNAQILRRAVGMAVVCQAWPGRQHNATPLHDVVRGAIGRILDYKRVHIVRIEDTRAVAGRVVEPLVMTIAELLENATRSSHPSTPVQVHVQLTHSGLAFVIEDAGVGLNTAEQKKVQRLLGDDTLGVAGLGNPPCFGLATCGALARRYGFSVWVDSASAFGGARAVVNVPGTLLTDAVAPPKPRATAAVAAIAPGADTNGLVEPAMTTAHGLPKRRRHEQPSEADETSPPLVIEPAPDIGAGLNGIAEQPAATTANGLPKRTRQRSVGQPVEDVPQPTNATPVDRSPSQAAAPLGAFQRAGLAAQNLRPSTEGNPGHDSES